LGKVSGTSFLLSAIDGDLLKDYSDALARETFRFSLIHLSALFAALLLDHYLL